MKKNTILLFALVSISISAQIKGKVTDTNNNSLPMVGIYLENNVTGTTSNDNGEYVLPIFKKGKYTVIFQFLGFKTEKENSKHKFFSFSIRCGFRR